MNDPIEDSSPYMVLLLLYWFIQAVEAEEAEDCDHQSYHSGGDAGSSKQIVIYIFK